MRGVSFLLIESILDMCYNANKKVQIVRYDNVE